MKDISNNKIKTNLKICSRCIYDERVSEIYFDADGVCNYCHQIEKLRKEYGTGKKKRDREFAKNY